MKRIIFTILTIFIIFSFVSCDQNIADEEKDSAVYKKYNASSPYSVEVLETADQNFFAIKNGPLLDFVLFDYLYEDTFDTFIPAGVIRTYDDYEEKNVYGSGATYLVDNTFYTAEGWVEVDPYTKNSYYGTDKAYGSYLDETHEILICSNKLSLDFEYNTITFSGNDLPYWLQDLVITKPVIFERVGKDEDNYFGMKDMPIYVIAGCDKNRSTYVTLVISTSAVWYGTDEVARVDVSINAYHSISGLTYNCNHTSLSYNILEDYGYTICENNDGDRVIMRFKDEALNIVRIKIQGHEYTLVRPKVEGSTIKGFVEGYNRNYPIKLVMDSGVYTVTYNNEETYTASGFTLKNMTFTTLPNYSTYKYIATSGDYVSITASNGGLYYKTYYPKVQIKNGVDTYNINLTENFYSVSENVHKAEGNLRDNASVHCVVEMEWVASYTYNITCTIGTEVITIPLAVLE